MSKFDEHHVKNVLEALDPSEQSRIACYMKLRLQDASDLSTNPVARELYGARAMAWSVLEKLLGMDEAGAADYFEKKGIKL